MARLLILIALCAVIAVAILSGPAAAAKHKPKANPVPAVTASDNASVPAVKGSGGGRFHY